MSMTNIEIHDRGESNAYIDVKKSNVKWLCVVYGINNCENVNVFNSRI